MKHLIILLLCAIGLTVTLCVASLDTAHPSNLIDLPEEIGQVASGDTLMVYHNRYGIRIEYIMLVTTKTVYLISIYT